jgi:hypothetical protein
MYAVWSVRPPSSARDALEEALALRHTRATAYLSRGVCRVVAAQIVQCSSLGSGSPSLSAGRWAPLGNGSAAAKTDG